MEGPAKGKGFKMKGHTLPGINQRIDANATNVAAEGLAGSSALQQKTMDLNEDRYGPSATQSNIDFGQQKYEKQKPSEFKKMGTVGARPQAEGSGDIDWKSENPENRPDWSFTKKSPTEAGIKHFTTAERH